MRLINKKIIKTLSKFLAFTIFLLYTGINMVSAQSESVISYHIYILAHNVGTELCHISDSSLLKIYNTTYSYNDRGVKNQLNMHFVKDKNGKPVYFSTNGFTSRWVKTGVHIKVADTANGYFFPIESFAPAAMQQQLFAYWQKNKEPSLITHASEIVLQRLKVKGLIWGNEFAWIKDSGELVFLSTNDTEGDKTEIINASYEALFDTLLAASNRYAIDAVSKQRGVADTTLTDIALTGGNLIDVTGKDSIIQNSLVVIQDGIIKYAGIMDKTKISSNMFMIDAKGKYILPGLWDMHAHLMQAEWLSRYIAEGVTTVRDCGNEFNFINALQQSVDDNTITGPRIIKAGLIDGAGNNALGAMQANTKEDAARLVHQYKNNAFSQIKIYSSVKRQMIKTICDEAHNSGMTVTGHIPNFVTAETAINDGMDMVSHISFFRNSMLTNDTGINYKDKRTNKFVQLLLDKHIVLDPTLSVYNTTDSSYIKNIPFYKTATYGLFKAGVPIVAGTDMSDGSVAGEVALYVDCGFTPLQAIQSATIVPAQVMKLSKHTGSIEAGKDADVILLNSNPLSDINNLKDIDMVIKGKSVYYIHHQDKFSVKNE